MEKRVGKSEKNRGCQGVTIRLKDRFPYKTKREIQKIGNLD